MSLVLTGSVLSQYIKLVAKLANLEEGPFSHHACIAAEFQSAPYLFCASGGVVLGIEEQNSWTDTNNVGKVNAFSSLVLFI
jgi:hypothetical protein